MGIIIQQSIRKALEVELTTKLTKIKNKTKGLEPLFLYNTDLNLNSFLLTHLRHKAIKDKNKNADKH